ncbi:MAG: NADPH-dependent 2,4-dienoyl-CoA reductase [Rhodospirillaceae bacterium]|nr:NADPH-dependent 2,4-dienoyl-CoA reductase [Rhodospirillaceae bacterium]
METANPHYPHLFTPLQVGSLTLPNRLMMGSIHTELEHRPDGMERLAAFYAERAAGGAALIATGGFSPNKAGNLTTARVEMSTVEDAHNHKVIPRAVHEAGGQIVLQVLHSGRYGYHPDIVAPSAVRSPINRDEPRALSAGEIEQTIKDYARAAELAREAGYDGVEVMGSEGYLITEFLSPRTNLRDDEWGGDFDNRMRFAVEVLRRVRARAGDDFLIVFRISALDLVDGGMTGAETQALAQAVEAAGADMLTTGVGWHEARIPTIAQAAPHAAFVWATENIKAAVSIPVAASNRINTPEVAEAIVAEGRADIAMMARPFLADEAFANKARAGDRKAINICIACNQACLDHYFEGRVCSCLVNPRAGFETKFPIIQTKAAKRIAVVGGGPGGLSCAVAAAERGHAVTLFEAADRLGGQFNLAQIVPGKEDFAESVAYFAHQLDHHGVTVRLNTRATVDMLGANDFDAVVLASGVTPRAPDIPGLDHASVARYDDVLAGRRPVGENVAIIGAGGIGFDVAIYLLEGGDPSYSEPAAFARSWGIDMTLSNPGGLLAEGKPHPTPTRRITMLKRSAGRFGATLGKTTGWVHKSVIDANGVACLAGVIYERIDDDGLHVLVDDEPRCIAADTIILCAGQEPQRDLEAPLTKAGQTVHLIGGARDASELDAKRAILEGLETALAFDDAG